MTAKKVVVIGAVQAALALSGSFFFWCWGAFSSHLFDIGDPGIYCGESDAPGHRLSAVDEHFLLPSAVCHFADGSSKPLIPWFSSSVMLVCPVAAVAAVVNAVHTLNKYELWV
jgi:hypothetical protein